VITWRPPVEGADIRYRVYSDLGSGGQMYTLRAMVRRSRFHDQGLEPATTYRYLVTTRQNEKESAPALIVVTTTGWPRLWPALPSLPPAFRVTVTPSAPAARITPRPTASSTPAPVVLDLTAGRDFTDDLGVMHVVGELRNNTDRAVGHVQIVATFYDRSGAVLDRVTGSTLLDVIPGGDAAPFHLTLPVLERLWNYSLRATGRPIDARPSVHVVVLHDRMYKDEQGFIHVAGQVENRGQKLIEFPRVVVTLYDPWGAVVNNGFVYTNPSSLAPGEKAAFDAYFAYFPQVESYRVQVWGR